MRSDGDVAEMARADGIDILVDLTLHMAYNRLLTFALKPAPIQVTYLGYCGTSGLEAIDYRLSDPHFDPPGMDESCYREKTIRIPSYWCYEPHERTPQESAAPLNALLTFGCLNHPGKVTSGTLKLWLEILRSRPEAQLVLHAPEGACREELRRQFSEGAIAPDRLEFLGVQPLNQYLESWRRIDIALDPFPYAGGVTTCDALWMGTPVVSLRGESILANLGLEEWIAESPEDYVRIALTLARDLPQLHELRGSLRERMKRSILCDAVAFARSVESAYRQMWRQWCASRCRQDQGDQTFLK
jgi:predicted O-linked N-acetylglucosamine transferase (SPINDLY family)